MNKTFKDYSEIAQWAITTLAVDKTQQIIDSTEDSSLIVEIKINGIEVDFEKIVASINRNFTYSVKKKAKEILSNKLGNKIMDITDVLNDIKENLERSAENLLLNSLEE